MFFKVGGDPADGGAFGTDVKEERTCEIIKKQVFIERSILGVFFLWFDFGVVVGNGSEGAVEPAGGEDEKDADGKDHGGESQEYFWPGDMIAEHESDETCSENGSDAVEDLAEVHQFAGI